MLQLAIPCDKYDTRKPKRLRIGQFQISPPLSKEVRPLIAIKCVTIYVVVYLKTINT